jgi:hypothetical protein
MHTVETAAALETFETIVWGRRSIRKTAEKLANFIARRSERRYHQWSEGRKTMAISILVGARRESSV